MIVNKLGLKGFEFDIPNQEVEYSGDNTEIEKWLNANFKFSNLEKASYQEVDTEILKPKPKPQISHLDQELQKLGDGAPTSPNRGVSGEKSSSAQLVRSPSWGSEESS